MKGIKGFTAVELLISVGLFGVIALFASQLYRQIDVTQKDTFLRADMEATNAVLNSLLAKDIVRIAPSFNYITIKGEQIHGTICKNHKFFDIVEKDEACGLQYVIDLSNREFSFLISNNSNEDRHEELMFPNEVFNGAVFSNSLLSHFLSVKTKVAFSDYLIKVESSDPEYSMLLVAKQSGSGFNVKTVHGDPARGKIVIPLDFDDASAPWCATYLKPSNFEQFLRCLEGTPGSQFVMLKPLRFIRYRVEESRRYVYPDERNGMPYVLMTLLRGSGTIKGDKVEFREHIVSNAVSKLVISRRDTSGPIIQLEAVVEKASYLKNLKRRKE